MNHPFRLLAPQIQREPNETVSRVAYVEDFLDPGECRQVLELAQLSEASEGLTGPEGKKDSARESTVRFIWPGAASRWLFDKLEYALTRLNEGYSFDLKGFYEGAQVAEYRSGGHYDWHMDLGRDFYSNRKLSMSVQLSPGDDYDGGELEFLATDELAPKELGTLIVFPSYMVHRVRPVTRGRRRSLVSWISGPPFR